VTESDKRTSYSLAFKYQTRVEVTDSDKRSSLLQNGINSNRKKFYFRGPFDWQATWLSGVSLAQSLTAQNIFTP
jgi:hypothetical protein